MSTIKEFSNGSLTPIPLGFGIPEAKGVTHMSKEGGASEFPGELPPGGAPGAENFPVEPEAASSAEAHPTAAVSFHEDPKIQDYIERQVEERAEVKLQKKLADAGLSAAAKINAIEEAERELIAGGLKLEDARRVISVMQKVSGHQIQSTVAPMQDSVGVMAMQQRIQNFAGQKGHEDFAVLYPKIQELYAASDRQTKEWIATNPSGLEHLYLKAQQLMPAFKNPARSGVSSVNRGNPSRSFSGEGTSSKASEALIKGDKKAYEQHARELINQ